MVKHNTMADLKPLTRADLMRLMFHEENIRIREEKIHKLVTEHQNQIINSAKEGRTFYTIQRSDHMSEIKSRLQKLFPDSKFNDQSLGNVLVSWEPITKPSEDQTVKFMQKILKQQTPSGGCFRCGRTSHWVQDCFASTDIHGNELD